MKLIYLDVKLNAVLDDVLDDVLDAVLEDILLHAILDEMLSVEIYVKNNTYRKIPDIIVHVQFTCHGSIASPCEISLLFSLSYVKLP